MNVSTLLRPVDLALIATTLGWKHCSAELVRSHASSTSAFEPYGKENAIVARLSDGNVVMGYSHMPLQQCPVDTWVKGIPGSNEFFIARLQPTVFVARIATGNDSGVNVQKNRSLVCFGMGDVKIESSMRIVFEPNSHGPTALASNQSATLIEFVQLSDTKPPPPGSL
jgi:hypothetical protein